MPEQTYASGETPAVGDRVTSPMHGEWTVAEIGERHGPWLFSSIHSNAGAKPGVCTLVQRRAAT